MLSGTLQSGTAKRPLIEEAIYNIGWHAVKPDDLITVSRWADDIRMLSQKASSEPGRWRTSRTPYLREIMDNLSPSSPVQRVVFMKGAQIGATEAGNNWLGYIIHRMPGPTLVVQPTVDVAKKFSKQRIAPMIAETPELREKISPARERDSGNTLLIKEFQGGVLVMAGANSSSGLRSLPIKNLFLDEVDAYPSDVEGEGDPVKLAERRTTTFARRKIFIVSTPTIKDISRIEKEYNNSDQRRYYVPCPECGHMDWIRWANIKFDKELEGDPKLLCEECGCLISEHNKAMMLAAGEWRATAPGDKKTYGYHLSTLYSPLGWKSWKDIVAEFLEAKNDPPRLKEWVNTVLGETWEEEYSTKIGADALAERAEQYDLLSVPMDGLVLTAGIDVQDNRIAVKVKAWGADEESWIINWIEIYGDPAQQKIWQQVDDVLLQDYMHESGMTMRVLAAAVDTGGHYTNEAYVFCRARRKRHVIAIKGSSAMGKPPISKPTRQDINYKNQTIKKGVDLWFLGTDTIKATIYGRLKNTAIKGAGVMHFPLGLEAEYYKQLTAEKQITKYHLGFAKRIWFKKDGARNEALDCEVYSYGALQYLYTRHNRNTIWLQLRNNLSKFMEGKSKNEEAVTTDKPLLPDKPKGRSRPNKPRTGFVTGWKK